MHSCCNLLLKLLTYGSLFVVTILVREGQDSPLRDPFLLGFEEVDVIWFFMQG